MKKTLIVLLVIIALGITGCGSTSRPDGGAPSSILITRPSGANTPLAPGGTTQLVATGLWPNGSTQVITGEVTWSSSDPGVATVSTTGLITAVGPGTTTITATYEGVSSSFVISVAGGTLQSIAISPANSSAAPGTSRQFTAQGTYSDGSVKTITATVAWTSSTASVASISSTGLASALTAGTTTIGASLSGVTASTTFTVTAATVQSISISPSNPSLAAGSSLQLHANATFSDGSTQDISSSVVWTSGTTSVATIGATGLVAARSAGSSLITATSGSVSATTTVTITSATLTSITISPSNPSFHSGTSQQFTATAHYSDGSTQNITSSVTWSSSNSGVVSIDANGLATASSAGQATITASFGGVSSQVSVSITAAALNSISVAPSNPSVAAGTTQQFTATGNYADGSTQNLTASVVWASSSTNTATITSAGLATAVAPGTASISATYGGVTSSTNLTVTTATVVSISISPSNPTFAVGTSLQFTATATYSDGSTQNVTGSVTWSSSGPAVSIDANGLATGAAVGSGTISVSYGGSSNSTNVSISPATLSSISVSPNDPSIAAGTTQQFTATGYFSDGSQQNLTSSVTWSTSSSAASISATGLATANSVGSATITAVSGSTSAQTTLTITAATLVSISITPSNPSIAAGTTVQFHATGTFSDGSTQDLTSSLNWSSSSSSVVSINGSGLATGVASGNATITGASGSISKSVSINITPATVSSIAVTPSSASIAAGTTQQFTATATFSDSSTQDLSSQVTWSSSTSAASINSSGLATANSVGTAAIQAVYNSVSSNSATLTVTAATLQSITLTPANPSAPAGDALQLTATGNYSDGSTQNLTTIVSWSTSDASTATVSSSGVVTGKKAGTVTITATDGSTTNSITYTVGNPVLVSITITPASPTAPSGETAQLTATGNYSDGSTQNLTTTATWATDNSAVATVNSSGLVTAAAQGTADISATFGSVNSSVTFTSSAPVLVAITLSPVSPSIPAGETQQIAATGHYSDGSTLNVTTNATWTSSNTNAATVNSTGFVTTKAVGSTTITSTLSGISGTDTINVIAAALQSIAVTPANPSAPLGTAQQFTATGTYSDGSTADITSSVTWSSSDATVATINSSGLASTAKVGTTNIQAVSGAVNNGTVLTVTAAQLTSINVTPAATPDRIRANSTSTQFVGASSANSPANSSKDSAENSATPASGKASPAGFPINLNGIITTIALGTEQQFVATGTYTDGSTHDLTPTATWSASLPTIASITAPGLALGTAIGSTEIMAAQGGYTGATTLNVTPAILASLAIVPIDPSVAAGSPVQFVATGTFTDGSTQDLTATATWTSSSPLVASVTQQGTATALIPGTTTIEAQQGTTTNSTTLTVTPAVLLSIAVTPPLPTVANGLTQQFTATGTYSDGSTHDLTSTVTWNSAVGAVAIINSSGLATAKSPGTTVIGATLGAISGVTTMTVSNAVLESLIVTPPNPSIAAGTVQQFIAYGNYSDGTQTVITPLVSWTSSSASVATIGITGLASGLAQGTSKITATLGSVSGSTQLTVTPAVLLSIAVTPAVDTVPLGGTVQYTATGTFSDLSTQNLTSTVAWTSSASSVAIVNNSGLATSSGTGLATITATSGSISGTAALTVTSAALVSITIGPSNPTCPAGGTEQLGAVGLYSNGNSLNLNGLVSWQSSNPTQATVSPSGLVTCLQTGTPTITATLLLISGTTTVTVTSATLQSITVTAATQQATLGLLDQMTATGHFSDGSTRDITSSVNWSVSPAILATISQSGGLLAVGVGNCTVTATSGSISGSTVINLLL